jgi:hypothetical protein
MSVVNSAWPVTISRDPLATMAARTPDRRASIMSTR